jgi:hypothetical protein
MYCHSAEKRKRETKKELDYDLVIFFPLSIRQTDVHDTAYYRVNKFSNIFFIGGY